MKNYLPVISTKIHVWNLFFGLVLGSAIATFAVSAMAPNADEVVRICRMDPQSQKEDQQKRYDNIIHSMNMVTDQKTYVAMLITHHELEMSMSRRVLELSPAEEVRKMANRIVEDGAEEVRILKDMLGKL